MEKNYSVSLAKDSDYFKKINELIKIEGGDIDIYVENKVIVGYRIWIDGEILIRQYRVLTGLKAQESLMLWQES